MDISKPSQRFLGGGEFREFGDLRPGGWRWGHQVPLPSARSEISAAKAGDRIYVIGDFGGQRATEIYDPVTNTWRRGADFPLAIHHTAAVGWKDKVYVLGGYVDDWRPTDGVYEYDIGLNQWRALPVLPTPRGSASAVVLDGHIHVVGGVSVGGRNTPAHETYDIATGLWTARAGIPTPRDHFALVVLDERIYALGGRIDGDYSRNLASNQVTTPKTIPGRIVSPCLQPAAESPRLP